MELDATTLEDIFRSEGRALLAATVRRARDPDLAVDVVGEAFARAFERRDRFRGGSREEAVAWLHAIARNVLADHHRRSGAELRALRRMGVERPVMGDDERRRVEALVDEEAGAGLAGALRHLPQAQQDAVRARVLQGASYEEIAARLNVSPQVVRARVSRGLRGLAGHANATKERTDAP